MHGGRRGGVVFVLLRTRPPCCSPKRIQAFGRIREADDPGQRRLPPPPSSIAMGTDDEGSNDDGDDDGDDDGGVVLRTLHKVAAAMGFSGLGWNALQCDAVDD
ncbi:uncharacterized protein K489DRAFT_369713 [Dissoconium aciculare CBS 342.82]|uniref:Uncharacterized protein n=1 Tax=Dissoconium aciculare CBS 342.82 TaxID=1314786 RepID=A0A6J3M737_9PEZI|nr:uncharacterized protein K489DRAFT_369713 [Dissoconium aciculare CBS 342.82]KAF1823339.1 hypothetical protein K489DRAFT_369713 [Dissoconium aciculare CBS 342.82]